MRLNKEIGQRTYAVAILPGETVVIRLVGAVLPEQRNEWRVGKPYLRLEPMALLKPPVVPAVENKEGA